MGLKLLQESCGPGDTFSIQNQSLDCSSSIHERKLGRKGLLQAKAWGYHLYKAMGLWRPKDNDIALQLGTVSRLFSCLMNGLE